MIFRVTTSDPTHAGDGALLAIIDDEPTRDAAIDEHLARCASCTARLQQLRELSEGVSAQIASIAVPAFDVAAMRARVTRAEVNVRPGRAWLPLATRVAATVVLVAGVAWASPMRGWIAKQFRTATEPVSGEPKTTAATPISPSINTAGMVVRFSASSEELVVRLDARQTGGLLELSSSTDRQISAQIAAHAGSEEMMVLPGELRILNSPASTADYRVAVPGGVRAIRVIVGSGAARVVYLTPGRHESVRLSR